MSVADQNVGRELGGEVEAFIKEMNGKVFKCDCRAAPTLPLTKWSWRGYPDHSGGLKDKDGVGWWIWVLCPHCTYQWSHQKVRSRAYDPPPEVRP